MGGNVFSLGRLESIGEGGKEVESATSIDRGCGSPLPCFGRLTGGHNNSRRLSSHLNSIFPSRYANGGGGHGQRQQQLRATDPSSAPGVTFRPPSPLPLKDRWRIDGKDGEERKIISDERGSGDS